jgi:hypothetical protein
LEVLLSHSCTADRSIGPITLRVLGSNEWLQQIPETTELAHTISEETSSRAAPLMSELPRCSG